MLNGFLAVLSGLIGIVILFIFWHRKYPAHGAAIFLGWVLLAGSSLFWVASAEIEFGIVFSLLMPSLYAWMVILVKSEHKPIAHTHPKRYQFRRVSYIKILRNGGLFFLVIIFLAMSSTFITLVFTYSLPIKEVNRMAVGALLMPMVWGGAVVWVLIDGRRIRPILINGISGLFSATYLFLWSH